MPVALTVAGSDSGGGAGIVTDVATFAAFGVWATVAVTAITAQNTVGVQQLSVVEPSIVYAQIESVATDIGVDAFKTGMLGTAAVVSAVASAVSSFGLPAPVVDPVLVSSSGRRLLDADGVEALRDQLLPLAAVVTPNLAEAAVLTGLAVTDRDGMAAAGRALLALGCQAALITGGHLYGAIVADCLVERDAEPVWIEATRVTTRDTHGTGCVLSAAIAAQLALGEPLRAACVTAADFVRASLATGRRLGAGTGPVDPARAGRRRA